MGFFLKPPRLFFMEANENTVKLYYNTEREKLRMPEYGRNVLEMIERLKTIRDRDKRSEQARAVIKSMEVLNPQVHQQENYEQKLWDHLFIMAGLDLDIDAPYPAPTQADLETKPMPIPLKDKPIKATHYGRNIESIIDLIASEPDGENKTNMIRSLAIYMRQQYLIWNKDSVADYTIFKDIEKLSDYRITVPKGLTLDPVQEDGNYARPTMSINVGQGQQNRQQNGRQQNGRQWNRRNGRRNNMNKK